MACSLPKSLPHLNAMCDKMYSSLKGPPLIFASGDPGANISWTKQNEEHSNHSNVSPQNSANKLLIPLDQYKILADFGTSLPVVEHDISALWLNVIDPHKWRVFHLDGCSWADFNGRLQFPAASLVLSCPRCSSCSVSVKSIIMLCTDERD
jgi:hypothetical protein